MFQPKHIGNEEATDPILLVNLRQGDLETEIRCIILTLERRQVHQNAINQVVNDNVIFLASVATKTRLQEAHRRVHNPRPGPRRQEFPILPSQSQRIRLLTLLLSQRHSCTNNHRFIDKTYRDWTLELLVGL